MAKDIITRLIFKHENGGLDKARDSVAKYVSSMTDLGGAMNSVLGMMPQFATAAGAVATVGSAIMSNIQTAREFEKSMSSLSAITGMTGGALKDMEERAINLAGSSTQTATQVAQAFQLIGSQKPELLSNADALEEVTKHAITLAEASGMDVPSAAAALTGSLNQMGAGADKAGEYINILAAASQQGAGDINFLNTAIVQSGATAKMAGISYNELVASLEAIAEGGFDASTAGTGLRNVILQLEKQNNDNFKPSVVGINQALANLSAAGLDTTEMMDMFGKGNVAVAASLINGAEKAAALTDSISGTNTATEQAQTNTNNLDGSLNNLSSAWEKFNLHLNSSNGFLKVCVDWLVKLVNWMDSAATEVRGFFIELYNESSSFRGEIAYLIAVVETLWEGIKLGVKNAINAFGYLAKTVSYTGSAIEKILTGDFSGAKDMFNKIGDASKDFFNKFVNNSKTAAQNVASIIGNAINETMNGSIAVDANVTTTTPTGLATPTLTDAPTGGGGSGGSGGKGKGNKTAAIDDMSITEGSIREQEEMVKELRDLWVNASSDMRESYKSALDAAQAKLDEMQGKTKEVQPLKLVNTETLGDIEVLNDQLRTIQNSMKAATNPEDWMAMAEAQQQVKDQLADINMLQSLMQTAIQEGLDTSEIDVSGMWQQILNGENIPDETWETLATTFQEKLDEMGSGLTLKINVDSGTTTTQLKQTEDAAKKSAAQVQGAASAFNALGSALNALPDPGAKVAGLIAQAIGNTVAAFGTAQTQAATMGPWAWIAFAATGLATVFSTIAGIKEATAGAYANGGVVPGNSYEGDRLWARVNSGEVVLNSSQSAGLNAALDSIEGGDSDGGSFGGNRNSVITGEQIVTVVNAWGRRTGRGEILR